MNNLIKTLLALGLLVIYNPKKEIDFSNFFHTTTKIIQEYNQEHIQENMKKEIIESLLANDMSTYQFVYLDSFNNIIKTEQEKDEELETLRKKMIITSIVKEWHDYSQEKINQDSIAKASINPKNSFDFNFNELEKTIYVFLEFERRYNLDWKTSTAHSLKESLCNHYPYGKLDEHGPFHIREKVAREYFKYVKQKFLKDSFASHILGDEFDAEKLKEPIYNSFFYLYFIDSKIKYSNSIEEALKKYNAGSKWKTEKADKYYSDLKKNMEILSKYDFYSRKNPEGFAFFYLMTLFPEFKIEATSIEKDLWNHNFYENEILWRKIYRIDKEGYYSILNNPERIEFFKKNYDMARDFVKKSKIKK